VATWCVLLQVFGGVETEDVDDDSEAAEDPFPLIIGTSSAVRFRFPRIIRFDR
jgi:hypothetical protein